MNSLQFCIRNAKLSSTWAIGSSFWSKMYWRYRLVNCRLKVIFLLLLAPIVDASEAPYSLTIAVNARHLDYSHFKALCRSIKCHPNVGHAWIRLKGIRKGTEVILEGGHSGELGISAPRYLDGVMDRIDQGHRNPISYLWATLQDGFFQTGSGGHQPTYAAQFDLTQAQFEKIWHFVNTYPYSAYSLTGNQCASFVAQVARLAGCPLEHQTTVRIGPVLFFRARRMCLWKDRCYSQITLSTPDVVERSLMEAVNKGQCCPVLWDCRPYSS